MDRPYPCGHGVKDIRVAKAEEMAVIAVIP